MKMRKNMPFLDSYPGTRCLSRWNGGFPLISGLTQDKTLNSEMGNSNYRVTGIDSMSSYSQHDSKFSNFDFNEKCTSAQSGEENSSDAMPDPLSKLTRSVSSTGALFSQTSIDFRQAFACVPHTYSESYTAGMFQAYGSHVVLSSNASGLANPRLPLPRQPSDEELIYVNPKQYNGIVRRRQLRAKLEAQKKLTRGRKPYLHESRHLHAMRRVRGSGGRFVNTKQHHQRAPSPRSGNKTSSTSTPLSDVADMFYQNQSNNFNQNNYSSHTSYNSEVCGGNMHH